MFEDKGVGAVPDSGQKSSFFQQAQVDGSIGIYIENQIDVRIAYSEGSQHGTGNGQKWRIGKDHDRPFRAVEQQVEENRYGKCNLIDYSAQ
jgi:hypothetical protein